jgi:HTH-type transcriptional regulator/antitoxin HigA
MTNIDDLIQPIRTEVDYQAALQLVAPYFENEPEIDSDAGAHFEAMLTLIEAYEAKHYPIASPNPMNAVTVG